jgi:hypothetical protein
MSKKNKKPEEEQGTNGGNMSDFEDQSWVEERSKEIEKEMASSFDSATSIFLMPRWDGVYDIRLLPIAKGRYNEWLMPFGQHWGVIPSADGEPKLPVGCPKVNFGDPCPICDSIEKLVAEGHRKTADFSMSGNGLSVNRRVLVRGLLIDFEPADSSKKNAPKFDFSEGPLMRIFALPSGTVGKELNSKLQNPRFGLEAILSPKTGKIISIEKSPKIRNYWSTDLTKEYPLDEKWLQVDEWPDMVKFIPKTSTEDLLKLIAENERRLDVDIVNCALSIDAGVTKQIPESTGEERKSIQDRLKEI